MATSKKPTHSKRLVSLRSQLICRVVRVRCSPKLNDMAANPLGEIRFRAVSCCGREHHGDDVRLIGEEVETVQTKKHHHREERRPLVAVTIWMVLHNAVSICRCQARKIRTPLVRPFVSRSSKSRLQLPIVAKTWQAAVFSNLIQVYRVNDHPLNPPWFGPVHWLFRQLTESVAVAFCGASRNCERLLRFRIVRGEENSVFGFDSQESVAGCNSEAISHVFWEGRAHGAAHSAHSDFLYHIPCFVGAE